MRVVSLMLALLISSCTFGDYMKDIEAMMGKVIQSQNNQAEEKNIEKVWRYIGKKDISIQVFAVYGNGREIDINTLDTIENIKTFRVIFEKGKDTTSIKWSPKANNNIFILFRE